MLRTLSFIATHPLTRERPLAGFARFVRWQVQSRLCGEVEIAWIGGAKLVARNGMAGATGNIYCGLHEFADMGFLLHLLREGDVFADIGANIGSYTILASRVVGADTIAVEPDPVTVVQLRRNIGANDVTDRVATVEAAVGRAAGTAHFTVGLDTTNHIASEPNEWTREVEVRTLDQVLDGRNPLLIKLDVEGFEEEVIAGARETLGKRSLLAIQSETWRSHVSGPLAAAGFERLYYEPFSRRLSTIPNSFQSNALFVRDRDVVASRLMAAPTWTVLGKSF